MPSSDFLEAALPPPVREAFARRLVRFHLEELNGLADRLRWLETHADASASEEVERVWKRCEETLQALSWNAQEVARLTWEWVEQTEVPPGDTFAPALVLSRLGGGADRVRAWLEAVPQAVRELARLT
jgi:hypothetical protein